MMSRTSTLSTVVKATSSRILIWKAKDDVITLYVVSQKHVITPLDVLTMAAGERAYHNFTTALLSLVQDIA
jgi:hypothetical protein